MLAAWQMGGGAALQQTDVTPTLAAPGVQRLPSVSSQGVSIDSITLPTRQRDIECARGTTSLVFFLLSLFTSPARTPLFFTGTTSITSDNPWPSFRFRDYRFTRAAAHALEKLQLGIWSGRKPPIVIDAG